MHSARSRQLRQLELVSRRQLAGLLGGGDRSRFRGQGLEFAELRPYQPGDDPRLIDWKVTARQGHPHVRCYQEERSRQVLLLADLSSSIGPTKFELLQEAAALLAFAAIAQRDRIGLLGFNTETTLTLAPEGSTGQVHRLLGRLAEAPRDLAGTNLAAPLQTALNILRRPGLILLLSDFHAPLPGSLLKRVAVRHDLVALILRDPMEAQLPGSPLLLRDAESGDFALCDGGGADRLWRQEEQRLRSRLRGLGFDHLHLDCGRPVLPALRRFFLRRRRRS